MKTIIKMIMLLSGTIVLLSCNKEERGDTRLAQGRVLEYGTNKPVVNAKVVLWEIGQGTILGPITHSRLIDSARTDESGYYKIRFDKGPYGYMLKASAALYNPKEVGQGTARGLITDIILNPHSWVRFNVKKITPPDQNDRISLGLNNSSCNTFFNGMVIDTFYICPEVGNREFSNQYRTTMDGKVEYKSITYQTIAHDTVDVLIEW